MATTKVMRTVPTARHKHAKSSRRTRRPLVPALAAAVLTLTSVGVAVWPGRGDDADTSGSITALEAEPERDLPASRSLPERLAVSRPSLSPTITPTTPAPTPTETPTPAPTVAGYMFVTAGLNVRTGPAQDAEVLTVLARGTKVGVTGTTDASWTQIIHEEQVAWVSSDYLSTTEPPAKTDVGISFAECESGSAVEAGLTPDAIRVHRAVCAEFPDVTSYGGVRSGEGEHSTGRALDIMVSSSSLGDAIAAWVRDNYDALGVSEILWSQQIWTVERSSEGWRWLEDRGSATANHYDHVHVTVYGDSGG